MINKSESVKNVGADIENQKQYIERVRNTVSEQSRKKARALRVYIATFGCQQNEADSERLLGSAIELGYEKTDIAENADLIIYNTCAVREHAELKALSKTGQLKKLKENNRELIIGLCGCMVSREDRVENIRQSYPYVDFVAGTNMLHRLPEILCDVMESRKRRYYVDDGAFPVVEGVPVSRQSDIKAWISVMYGCNNFCTYCIVPYVRGRERSRKPKDVIDEARALIAEGYKEITLLGQNVNSYGAAEKSEEYCTFAKLLESIAQTDGDFTLRFMTSHPKDVSDELIRVIKENPKIERHFHLPLQSGNNRILKEMNRKYTRESYLQTVERLKNAVCDIVLTTDIIVGFPNESDEEFEDTLSLVREVGFDAIYSFIYSPRPGTPAAKIKDEISYEKKTERFARLMSLHRENILKINDALVGKTLRVLCESAEDEKGYFSGRNSGYKLVRFTSEDKNIYGKFVDVKITRAGESQLFGEKIR